MQESLPQRPPDHKHCPPPKARRPQRLLRWREPISVWRPYQHDGHYGGGERREERSRWNRGGAGRNSEESSRSNGHGGNDHRYDDRRRHGNHSPRGQHNMSEHLEINDGDDQKFGRPEGHNGYYDGENPYRYGGQNGAGGRRREDVARIGRSRRGSESEDWDNRPVTNWAEYYAKQEWNEREGERRNAMRRAEQATHANKKKEEEREADSEVAKEEEDEDEKTETKLEAVRRLIRGHEETLPKLRELRRDMIAAGPETQKLEEVEESIRDSENTFEALCEAERVTLGEFQRRPPIRARLSTPPLSPIAPAPLPVAVVRSPTPPARALQVSVSTPRPQRRSMIPAGYRDDPSPAPARSAQATRQARAVSQVPGSGRPQRNRKRPAKFDD